MQPQSFEEMISRAASGGHEWFDQVDAKLRSAIDVQQEKDAEDARAISGAWADFAATPAGRKALERLFDTTLRRTVFFVQLGLDAQSMATFGAFREGQNAVAYEIARQIGLGNAEAVTPRET
ncbi:hypothetical protein [Rhizobium straminoryzae]|uniref:Uncharacterized protein n=1 Tax=Rhizobium straminoryzae TaxID=1387186 RepID=A0A549TD01_9HYPH|nr:hypothetical protein [Rhizobium straminoryzae]TRL39833.1 hypothetical protein FNA46_07820 [Rhizobium straminoryzae]